MTYMYSVEMVSYAVHMHIMAKKINSSFRFLIYNAWSYSESFLLASKTSPFFELICIFANINERITWIYLKLTQDRARIDFHAFTSIWQEKEWFDSLCRHTCSRNPSIGDATLDLWLAVAGTQHHSIPLNVPASVNWHSANKFQESRT